MDVVLNAEILRERDEFELCVSYNEVGEFDLFGYHHGEEVRLITKDFKELKKILRVANVPMMKMGGVDSLKWSIVW